MPRQPDSAFGLPRRETLFEQAARHFTHLIETDVWKVGEMIPNEVELARNLGVAQGTVRRALKLLTDQGVLIRRQGRGTFVAEFKYNTDLVYERYIRLEPDDAGQKLPTHTELALFERVPPTPAATEALGIDGREEILHISRVHYAGNAVVSFDESWLNDPKFAALTPENVARHEERTWYGFLQAACGVTITGSREQIKAEVLDPELCRRHDLPVPTAVLIGRRVACSYSGKPVEYRIQRSLTRTYHLRVEGAPPKS